MSKLDHLRKANLYGFITAETPIRAVICTLPFYHSGRNPDTIFGREMDNFFSQKNLGAQNGYRLAKTYQSSNLTSNLVP